MPYIQIKRSNSTATPASLNPGELAYSENSDNLFIGNIAGDGVIRIGGKSVIDELATVVHDSLFNANTILKADSDNTPTAMTVGASTIVGRGAAGSISALTPTQARTILNVEDGADVTDSTNVNAAGAIMHSDVSEATGYILKTASETYVGVKIKRDATVAPASTDDASSSYGIGSFWYDISADKVYVCVDATASAAVWKDITITSDGTVASTGGGYASDEIVVYASGTGEAIKTSNTFISDLVPNSLFNANTILAADTDNTPAALAIPEQTLVGRITAGNIDALTAAEVRTLINVADGANNYSHPNHTGDVTSTGDGATVIANSAVTNAKMANMVQNTIKGRITASTGAPEDLTAANVRSIINVEDGATADQVWGEITGTLSNQTDLDTALGLLAPKASPTFTGTVTIPEPIGDTDAATKGYVDGVAQGLDPKESVRLASTADITGTYSQAGGTSSRGQFTGMSNANIDGVAPAQGDRVLLKNQAPAAENGIWVITTLGTGSNGVWDRATDFDEDDEVTSGAFTFVEEGSTQANTGWVLSTADPITIGGAGGTSISFVQFSGAGSYTADETGITLSGTEFQLQLDGTTLSKSGSGVKVNTINNSEIGASAGINFSKMENLTVSRALVSDGSGDVSVSAVTSTEIGHLDGVTSGIQGQLDALAANFLELDDSPSSYTGHAGKIVVVNSTPNGLEFVDSIDAGTF